ncbi:MAG: hypothetical protein PQJ60_11020 [Spirochaetales bacterium]|nr:hypothetical protein [Spirochaetales bacterium]
MNSNQSGPMNNGRGRRSPGVTGGFGGRGQGSFGPGNRSGLGQGCGRRRRCGGRQVVGQGFGRGMARSGAARGVRKFRAGRGGWAAPVQRQEK